MLDIFLDVAGLVDEKGTHEQRLDFAKKADIVVTCCSLSSETVSTFAFLDNSRLPDAVVLEIYEFSF